MNKSQKIVFFGTHELATPALEALNALETPPQLVVTRPQAGFDVPRADPTPHLVQAWAKDHGIEVYPSHDAVEPELREKIADLKPDLLVVVEYGRSLPADLLDIATHGAIEVHPSLLPKLRGPHALRGAVAAGHKKTGVSVIRVVEEPWSGPVLHQGEIEIGARDSFGDLLPQVSELASQLLTKALAKPSDKGKPQKDDNASDVPDMGGQHRNAPWALQAPEVYDRLRAYSPPGMLAFYSYRPVEILSGMPMDWVQAPYGTTGTYLGMRQGKLAILCSGGTVFGIERLRRPGAEPQAASGFARAEEIRVGQSFM